MLKLLTAQDFADLITFTEEILNGKLHFLCSGYYSLEHTNYKFLDMIWNQNLNRVYFLINEVGQWFHNFGHVILSKSIFCAVKNTPFLENMFPII